MEVICILTNFSTSVLEKELIDIMASYWKQNDVLKVIKDYDDCNSILEELLNLETYNDDGKMEDASSNITNLNFICNAEEISKIIRNVAENNDGKITFVTNSSINFNS